MSMVVSPRTETIWRGLDERYGVADDVRVTNAAGTAWICRALLVGVGSP